MITGFNTDVKHGDTVYHVQTEDKGVKNPLILSLIYVKGTILDAFRIRYQDFLASDRFSEALLQKILEFQHRQIVGAIKRGKYQKGMALEDYVEGDFVFHLTSVAEPATGRKPEPPVHHRCPHLLPAPPAELRLPSHASAGKFCPAFDSVPPVLPVGSSQIVIAIELEFLAGCRTRANSALRALLAVDISEVSGDEGIEICVEGVEGLCSG